MEVSPNISIFWILGYSDRHRILDFEKITLFAVHMSASGQYLSVSAVLEFHPGNLAYWIDRPGSAKSSL